jgi:hypothetical protein
VEEPKVSKVNHVVTLSKWVDDRAPLVHLVNYAAPQGKRVSNVKVEVELPEGKGVRRVTPLTPDGKGSMMVPSRVAGGRVCFTVLHL